jgi:signal transduction histidine kinase
VSEDPVDVAPDFEAIFRSLPARCLILDPSWNIVAATDLYLESTMTVRDEIVGRHVFDVFPDNPDDPASNSGQTMRASLMRVAAGRVTDQMALARHDVRRPDGEFEERYWSPANIPVIADDGSLQFILHQVENVTAFVKLSHADTAEVRAPSGNDLERLAGEIVQRRTEVAEASRHLKETNVALEVELEQARRVESLGQLAGGVAHDFNNLLGVIMNYAAFVREVLANATDGPDATQWESARRDIAQIERASERAAQLVRQLLLFARREMVQPRRLNVNEIVADIEALLTRTIGEDIELHTDLDPELWIVSVDPGHVEQVLVNLAVNARAAMPNGGTLRIVTRNETVAEEQLDAHPGLEPGRYVRISVSDNGTGMDQAVKDHAFDPFFTTQAAGEGSGLGLATVRGIVTQARGHTSISSEVGFGTMVSALLPAVDGEAVSSRSAPIRVAEGGHEGILVVEDDEAMRELTRRILVRGGYAVHTAATAGEACALMSEHGGDVDLLLTDVVMPQIAGSELAEKLRSSNPDLLVLFMSGHARPALSARGVTDDGIELVQKPFSEPALLARIREVLDR